MADKASGAVAPPQTPLTNDELAELDKLTDVARWHELSVTWVVGRVPALLAEVRRLRARVNELEGR